MKTWQERIESLPATSEVDMILASATENVTESGTSEAADSEKFWREVYGQVETEMDARGITA